MESDLDRDGSALRVVNVGGVLTSSLAVCPGDDGSVLVSREFDDRLRVACVEQELQGVIVILLRNAVEALATGPAEARAIRVAAWRTADERTFVEISDTGGGIAPTDLTHVFEPAFTTKVAPAGSGGGLAECQRLIEMWGGALYVRTTSTRGTSFRVELPSRPPSATVG